MRDVKDGDKSITIQVRRGTRVSVEEVDDLTAGNERVGADRDLALTVPADLKVAISRIGSPDFAPEGHHITMCG